MVLNFILIYMQNYHLGEINAKQFNDSVWKGFFQGKLTFLHWNKGQEMEPTIPDGGNFLVRKMIYPVPSYPLNLPYLCSLSGII